MTGTEIQSYIEARMGTQVESDLVIMAINEAIDMLGDDTLLYDTIEDFNVSNSSQWYSLPPDYTVVKKVTTTNDDGKEVLYMKWNYRNGEISFNDEKTYTITARKLSHHISDIADDLGLHRLYDNAIKFYALAWFKENDDDNDQAVTKYYERFNTAAQKAANTLIRTKAPRNVRVIRHA